MLLTLAIKIMRVLLFVSVCLINLSHYYSNLTLSIYVPTWMLGFGGIAQKLWVLHCLDCFLPFLSVAYLVLLPSFVLSRFAYLDFQSKEIVIDMLPHTRWYWSLSWLLFLSYVLVIWYCATVCRFHKGVIWSLNSQANHYIGWFQ